MYLIPYPDLHCREKAHRHVRWLLRILHLGSADIHQISNVIGYSPIPKAERTLCYMPLHVSAHDLSFLLEQSTGFSIQFGPLIRPGLQWTTALLYLPPMYSLGAVELCRARHSDWRSNPTHIPTSPALVTMTHLRSSANPLDNYGASPYIPSVIVAPFFKPL